MNLILTLPFENAKLSLDQKLEKLRQEAQGNKMINIKRPERSITWW